LDSTIFAFWAKTSVDIEAKRIRLKSNSYTSNTMLDTVTAATVQVLRQHYFFPIPDNIWPHVATKNNQNASEVMPSFVIFLLSMQQF